MSGRRNGTGKRAATPSGQSNLQKRPRAKAWACEPLERRRLFSGTPDNWITQGSGNWSTGSNWSTGAPPQPGQDVTIDVPGLNVVVTYNATSTLQFTNGATLTNNELLVLDGSGGATWDSGTWTGSGIVSNRTQLTISGSAQKTIMDGETIENRGTTIVTGSGNIVGVVGATINNFGTFNVESDMEITFPTGIGDGNFNNEQMATFIKSAGGTAAGDMTEIGGAQGFTFNNNGDCQVLQGTLGLGDNANTSESIGTFEVSSGATLAFLRGFENITAANSAITGAGTLNISGGSVQLYGVLNINETDVSAGEFLLQQNMTPTAGTPQLNTDYPDVTPSGVTAVLNLSGGAIGGNGAGIFTIPSGTYVCIAGQFNLSNGTYELPGLIVTGQFSWTGGDMSGTGRMVLDTSITSATISTTTAKAITGGYGLDILDEVDWTDSGVIDVTGESAIWIHPTGTLWDQGNGSISGDGDSGNVWNSGNFLKYNENITTANPIGSTLIDTGINFINQTDWPGTTAIPLLLYKVPLSPLVAVLDIRNGTFSFNGNSVNTDDITIEPGATLDYISGTHVNGTNDDLNNTAKILSIASTNSSNNSSSAPSTVIFGDNAFFTGDTEARLDVENATFGAGVYDFNNIAGGAQVIDDATFNGEDSGTIGGNGTIEIKDSFNWNSGTFSGTGGTTSSLLIDPGATLTMAAGDYTTTDSYSVQNDGTIEWSTSPGSLSINGNYDQTSTGTFISTLAVGTTTTPTDLDSLQVSGTVTLAGALQLNVSDFVPQDGEQFTLIDNAGTSPILGPTTGVAGIFTGLPEGSTVTVGSDTFVISYVGGSGNSVVLTSRIFPLITIATPDPIVRPETGSTDLLFTVSLSVAVNHPVTVTFTTTNGSAVAGTDYTAPTSTDDTITIPVGQTSGTITIPILGTQLVESALTFTVTLSDPVLGTLGTPSSAVGTIVDPNGPPVLSFVPTSYSVNESAGTISITVGSTNPSTACTVNYTTDNGTAIAGTDYTAESGTLSFAAGAATASFSVPIIDESIDEGQKAFTVVLSNPQGGSASLGVSTATVTILDNDSPLPTVSISNSTVTEPLTGQTNAVFTVSLSSAISGSATSVQYNTANGTAIAGIKYIAQSGTLTFPAGTTTQQITVPIISDFVQDSTESFSVQLTDPSSGLALGTNAVGTGTVLSQTPVVVSITAGHSYHYIDSAGSAASISLNGPGTATLTYLGLPDNAAKQLVLTGTTAQSQLIVKPAQYQLYAVDLIVDGSIGSINAPSLNMLGNVDITGAVQTLRLGSLEGGNSLTIGAGTGNITTVTATLGSVTDATLTSALPLASLRVSNWQDSDSAPDITAPSAGLISSTSNFQGNISLTGNLGTFKVTGTLANSDLSIAGNIADVIADSIFNSDIFAGVASGVTTLPTLASQFANTTSSIKRLNVTSHSTDVFANTLIAAPIIGDVQLGSADVSNSGSSFGVAGNSIAQVAGIGDERFKVTNTSLITSPFSDLDLVIRLT